MRRHPASAGGVASTGFTALDAGLSAPKVAQVVPFTAQAIRVIAKRYREEDLERALFEKKRTGHAELLQDSDKQRIIAVACSQPPEGRSRWTVRLIAEEAVKRKLVPGVGRETIRILLQSHDLKPWREKSGASPSWMKNTSPRWKTCWQCMKSRIGAPNLCVVWTRDPFLCMLMSAPSGQQGRVGVPEGITNTNAVAKPTFLLSWNLRVDSRITIQ